MRISGAAPAIAWRIGRTINFDAIAVGAGSARLARRGSPCRRIATRPFDGAGAAVSARYGSHQSRRDPAELSGDAAYLAAILAAARAIGLDLPAHPRLAEALATLDCFPVGPGVGLPQGTAQPFGPSWSGLIEQPDRTAALQSYLAATVMLLKRSLRNGSASVEHSLNHRAPEDRLIPAQTWQRERARLIHSLNVPASGQSLSG